ncbi:hypothetical protein HK101_001150 [Irineochytrium annulatum]|nr:hypothetical protein HK101_001150 [Irineochytrium annulatum]
MTRVSTIWATTATTSAIDTHSTTCRVSGTFKLAAPDFAVVLVATSSAREVVGSGIASLVPVTHSVVPAVPGCVVSGSDTTTIETEVRTSVVAALGANDVSAIKGVDEVLSGGRVAEVVEVDSAGTEEVVGEVVAVTTASAEPLLMPLK